VTRFDYDLFVIGAGSGGIRESRISRHLGARVAIAENYRFVKPVANAMAKSGPTR